MASGTAADICQGARRAPEIFLGQDAYTEAIDMWAVGCIFGELLRNEPLFPGRTEAEMLDRMVRLLGSPNETIWPVSSQHPPGTAMQPHDRLHWLMRTQLSVWILMAIVLCNSAGG